MMTLISVRMTITIHYCPLNLLNTVVKKRNVTHTSHKLKFVLLVNAGFGVADLIKGGNFKAVGTAPLSFVHVVSKGQDHLQKLSEVPALKNLF